MDNPDPTGTPGHRSASGRLPRSESTATEQDPELRAEDGFFGHDTCAYVLDSTPVEVAGLYFLPRKFRASIDDLELPCVVDMTVCIDDDGRAVCEEVTLRARAGGAVKAPMLRDVPLKRLTRLAASSLREARPSQLDGHEAHRSFVANFDKPAPPRRGRQYDEDHYREVARVYDAAIDDAESPIERVMETFYLAKSTAYRHVAMAKPYLSQSRST